MFSGVIWNCLGLSGYNIGACDSASVQNHLNVFVVYLGVCVCVCVCVCMLAAVLN